jgi:hypothetical protein
MSLRNGTACSLRKNAREHAMGAPGWDGAVRQPTLPEEESAESAETRGDSDGAGVLVERVKRSGWEASEAGRHDMCARTDDALRARTVLAYNMWTGFHDGGLPDNR